MNEVMIEDLMLDLVKAGGSDLHLAAGQPPYGRFNGKLRPIHEESLTDDDCSRLIFSLLSNAQRKQLEQNWELDCSYGLRGVGRFRINVYRQRGTYAACLRALSVSAFARLDEMGVEPFLVSASLLGVVSQRLVRKLCSDCRIPHQPGENELAHFGLMGTNESIPHFFRACTVAAGSEGACPRCNGRGYSGRVGVYEVLTMTESLATAVSRRASTNELRRLAIESGMKTLLGYGLELVRVGLTSLEEVERMLLTDTGLESERQARALSTLTCKGCGAGLQDEWLECPYCLATRS